MSITKEQLKETLRNIMKEESDYQAFFKAALEKAGKSIPSMSDEEKKEFFNKIDAAWNAKGEKNEGNAFGAAVTAAKEAGEDEFEVGGKTYKVEEGKKRFNTMYGVGSSKYVVNYHDGKKTHNDGSDFFDIKIFKNQKDLDTFKKALLSKGFVQESVNEAASRTAMEIGGLTGLNKDAIQKFVDTHNMDIEKVYQYVKKAKLTDRLNFVTAIVGTPGNSVQKKMIKMFGESVNEIANSKGYTPKSSLGAKIVQGIDINIKQSDIDRLKFQRLSNEEILKSGTTFLKSAQNAIKAAFKFNYKIHPDVDFPMKNPKDNYLRFNSREDMEKYLKVFLADLKKLDSMITSYLKKPTLKAQNEIVDFWTSEILVSSSRTGGIAYGIMTSDKSNQSIYESVNEEKYPIAVEKFNKELIKHPMVKKAAQHYKKTPAEIVKVLQQRLYTKGDKTGNTKEVWIDFKDTTSGITIKHKMKFNESVNEGVSPKDMDKIKSAVEAASSFMNIGSELKKTGLKYVFATSPMPIYVVQPTPNNRVAIVNKKYASKPDFVHGDTAVGVMESLTEGRAFINAAKKAKAEGKTEFEFNGKTYPVTIKENLTEARLGKVALLKQVEKGNTSQVEGVKISSDLAFELRMFLERPIMARSRTGIAIDNSQMKDALKMMVDAGIEKRLSGGVKAEFKKLIEKYK